MSVDVRYKGTIIGLAYNRGNDRVATLRKTKTLYIDEFSNNYRIKDGYPQGKGIKLQQLLLSSIVQIEKELK